MNINENQMLASFSDDFVKFRDEFLNLRNADYRHERQTDLEAIQKQQNASIAQHDIEIAAKKQELADLANDATLTDEDKDVLRTRKESELANLEEAKKIDQEHMADQEDKYYNSKDELRDKLKTLVSEFKEKLGYNNVFGAQMSRIDVLKADINSRIVSISYQFETIRQQLYATKNNGDRKPLAVEMQKLIEERKRLVELADKLETFEKTFANFERYLETNDFIEDMDLSNFSNAFETIADAVVVDVDKTLISVDIITNEDGSYSLDMRCGNKVCDPRPIIPVDKFNKSEVDSYLKGFAGVLANKTKMTMDDLISSNVILKANGVNLGRHQFKNVGELSEKVRDGKKDEILAAVGDQQNLGDGNQPTQPGDGNQPTQPGDGNQPTQPGDGNQPTQPGDGNQPTGSDDDDLDYGNSNEQAIQQSNLPELDAHAMKVNSARNARSKFYNKLKGVTLVAAVGLGLTGPALGIGMAGALIAGGLGVAGVAAETYVKLKENIKYGARRHKMKKLAKKMSKEAGVNIEFVMDNAKRKAGFKLEGDDQFLTTDDLRDPNLFPEGMDDAIIDIFDEGVERLNKYRGKGEGAKTLKENRFKNFPRITFDNVSAAFDDFGGVKSWKELNDYQFDYNKIIQAQVEEQQEEENINENDQVGIVDPDELADMEAALEQGQQQNLGDGDQQNLGDGNQPTQPGDGTQQNLGDGNQPQPVVVNPLAPSTQDPNVTQIQFPQDVQDQLKSDLTDWVRSEVQDPTNGIEVADKLEEAINGRRDELSEQSRIDLVNLFHDEVSFTEGQMEKLDFICRHDRTLTDFEVREAIAQLEEVRATQGEVGLGSAVSTFLSSHSNLTKEDLEALHNFDTSKNMGFEQAINSKFNGQAPTL